MAEVALYEAKNRLSELIERVQAGEVVLITRRGKVVAQLALPSGQDRRTRRAMRWNACAPPGKA